jgi:hypothetical protein
VINLSTNNVRVRTDEDRDAQLRYRCLPQRHELGPEWSEGSLEQGSFGARTYFVAD